MSVPLEPKPAKLVIGLFMKDRMLFKPLAVELTAAFGSIDMVSSWITFDHTTYYVPEMGTPLFRRLLTFKTLINQAELASIKMTTNRLESHSLKTAGAGSILIRATCCMNDLCWPPVKISAIEYISATEFTPI